MNIVMGAPISNQNSKPHVGALIFLFDDSIQVYKKQFLHGNEVNFFISGQEDLLLSVKDKRIGLAVCADTPPSGAC
jgi:predicted amidohydrolase